MELLSVIPTLIPTMPLFFLVLAAVIYAGINREAVGRPANLVMIGGILVLIGLVVSMTMNIFIMMQAFDYASIGAIAGLSGFVTMVITTTGWGMIIYAAFVDRNLAKNKNF